MWPPPPHEARARALRLLLASYARSEDLIRIGAYQKGSDPTLDRAVDVLPRLNHFLHQQASEIAPLPQTLKQLLEIPA